ALAGNNDADEIERISSRNASHLTRTLRATHRAQRFQGDWQCELLADKAADEASATHFAAVFQPAETLQQLPPFRQQSFAGQHFTENYSIAVEQHAAVGLDV